MKRKSHQDGTTSPQAVAGNGLLDRRALLGSGIMLAGAMTAGVGGSLTGAAAEPLENGPWSLGPGVPIPPYGQPSKFEQKVVRTIKAGQTARINQGQWIVEQPNVVHQAANNGNGTIAIYLATLLPNGDPPSVPNR